MSPAALLLAAAALFPGQAETLRLSWECPVMFIEGEGFPVRVELRFPERQALAPLAAWQLTPAAFTLNGRPLGKRDEAAHVPLAAGTRLELSFDLAPAIGRAGGAEGRSFRLGFGLGREVETRHVNFLQAAEKGIQFMELPQQQLGDYQVVLRTSRGDLWLELWPQDAPNHVRNFLDLCYTGFYDGTTFHRVVPTFMIQGGSPKPGFAPPRTLRAEFNARKHVPGVLSMARLPDEAPGSPHTATCEFFIMHGVSPRLDASYTAFGRLLAGLEVVDAIAQSGNKEFSASDERSHLPPIDQVIQKAIVVKAPALQPRGSEEK